MPPSAIPPASVIEVISEPTAELFADHPEALVALLRMALLSGVEMTLPTLLHLLLDVAQSVVRADRQLVVWGSPTERAHTQVARHFASASPPTPQSNLLNEWAGHAGKPLIVECGQHRAMDTFLNRVEARCALAAPLFHEHNWSGSLQLFCTASRAFSPEHARLLSVLSLLAENQISRIYSFQHLTRMAYTDYLTGVRARGYFEKALEQEVRRALRQSTSCGLALIDLDDFKSVNDRYGHHAGDAVLRQFATLLGQDMREVDTVARFGGDEFALVLPDTDQAGVELVIGRLQQASGEHVFTIPNCRARLHLGISAGIALCPGDERAPGPLIRAADLALYQAKLRGKNRPFFFHELRRAG